MAQAGHSPGQKCSGPGQPLERSLDLGGGARDAFECRFDAGEPLPRPVPRCWIGVVLHGRLLDAEKRARSDLVPWWANLSDADGPAFPANRRRPHPERPGAASRPHRATRGLRRTPVRPRSARTPWPARQTVAVEPCDGAAGDFPLNPAGPRPRRRPRASRRLCTPASRAGCETARSHAMPAAGCWSPAGPRPVASGASRRTRVRYPSWGTWTSRSRLRFAR